MKLSYWRNVSPAVCKAALYVALLCTAKQFCYGQIGMPLLPDEDYSVYSAVINGFSDCLDSKSAFRRDGLLLVSNKTVVPGKNDFDFDFSKAQELLEGGFLAMKNQFYKEPGWVRFLGAVDTTQFIAYQLIQLPVFQCRKSSWFTPEQSDYYFGRAQQGQGYIGLRRNYPTFLGVVRFSKVAYSPDHSKALCYYSEASDGENGAGYVVFLEKKGNVWQLVGSCMLWIA